MEFKAEVCKCCGQKITYLVSLDKGTAYLMRALSVAIKNKGVNCIHPRNELEGSKLTSYEEMIKSGKITSNMTGNLSKARFNGLIAKVKGQAGCYCLTNKGIDFLKGKTIPKIAIVDKSKKANIGYLDEYTNIQKLLGSNVYWEGIKYNIENNKVIHEGNGITNKDMRLSSDQEVLF